MHKDCLYENYTNNKYMLICKKCHSDSKYNHEDFKSMHSIILIFIDFLFGLKQTYLDGEDLIDLILDLDEF